MLVLIARVPQAILTYIKIDPVVRLTIICSHVISNSSLYIIVQLCLLAGQKTKGKN